MSEEKRSSFDYAHLYFYWNQVLLKSERVRILDSTAVSSKCDRVKFSTGIVAFPVQIYTLVFAVPARERRGGECSCGQDEGGVREGHRAAN